MKSTLSLRIDVAVWRWGAAVPVALGIAIAVAVAWWNWLLPLQHSLELSRTKHALGRIDVTPSSAETPVQAQLAAWQALRERLPVSDDLEGLLNNLYGAAESEAIRVQGADYQYRFEPQTGWLQVTLNVAVRGTYPATRRYVEFLLRRQPNLALDEMTLRREASGTDQGEIRLHWTAWFRAIAPIPSVAPASSAIVAEMRR